MRTTFGLMAVLAAFAGQRAACAQGIFGITPPRPGDLPVAPGKASTPDKRPSSPSYYYYWGPSNVRGSVINPYCSVPVARVTFLYFCPPPITTPPPVVRVLPPRPNRDEDPDAEIVPPPRRPQAEAPAVPQAIAPGAPASVFRLIRPEDRARALVPALPERARPPEPALPKTPKEAKVRPPLRELPPLPGPPVPESEPKRANAQQVRSGKEAFQARAYSRAERRFHRATEVLPEDPVAHFLLAQARFAVGKYEQAVAAIHAGMWLQPDWPGAPFRPRELYGANADDFSVQLKRLGDALAKNPDDPFLPFLYAYQLWFDNRKDEARPFFQRAKALAPDPSFIDRFLQAKAASPVAAR